MRNEQIVSDAVSKVTEAATIDEIKSGLTAFIKFYEEKPKLRKRLCGQLIDEAIIFGANYIIPKPNQKRNAVFIPPKAAPVVMILSFIPKIDDAEEIYEGLKRYLSRCNEFTEPIEDIVTEKEMRAVIDSAQTKFKILDIVAPAKPLMIVSLNNSHIIRDSECGISADKASRESVIFVYHPRDVSKHDRVFIFAHELGHALHLALTGDVDVIPDKFDAFNESLGVSVKLQTIPLKQEAFADVTAFAILSGGKLEKHLPHQFSEPMLEAFNRYIGFVTGNYLKK